MANEREEVGAMISKLLRWLETDAGENITMVIAIALIAWSCFS
jgi:hypothetical protein